MGAGSSEWQQALWPNKARSCGQVLPSRTVLLSRTESQRTPAMQAMGTRAAAATADVSMLVHLLEDTGIGRHVLLFFAVRDVMAMLNGISIYM